MWQVNTRHGAPLSKPHQGFVPIRPRLLGSATPTSMSRHLPCPLAAGHGGGGREVDQRHPLCCQLQTAAWRLTARGVPVGLLGTPAYSELPSTLMMARRAARLAAGDLGSGAAAGSGQRGQRNRCV